MLRRMLAHLEPRSEDFVSHFALWQSRRIREGAAAYGRSLLDRGAAVRQNSPLLAKLFNEKCRVHCRRGGTRGGGTSGMSTYLSRCDGTLKEAMGFTFLCLRRKEKGNSV